VVHLAFSEVAVPSSFEGLVGVFENHVVGEGEWHVFFQQRRGGEVEFVVELVLVFVEVEAILQRFRVDARGKHVQTHDLVFGVLGVKFDFEC
jgi:hypothetical protein